jgi:hypothetical protein
MTLAHEYLAAKGIPLATNQVPYSLLTRQIESNGILDHGEQCDDIQDRGAACWCVNRQPALPSV